MDQDFNRDLAFYEWLVKEIDLALIEYKFAKFEGGFGRSFDRPEAVPGKFYKPKNPNLLELYLFASEYFDSFAHGFEEVYRLKWPEARAELIRRKEAVRGELALD